MTQQDSDPNGVRDESMSKLTRRGLLGALGVAGLASLGSSSASANLSGGPEADAMAEYRVPTYRVPESDLDSPGVVGRRVEITAGGSTYSAGDQLVDLGDRWDLVSPNYGSLSAENAGIESYRYDPDDPLEVVDSVTDSSNVLANAHDAYIDDGLIYGVGFDGSTGGLAIYRWNESTGLSFVGSTTTNLSNDGFQCYNMDKRGEYVYISAYDGTDGRVAVVRVTNPASPIVRGTVTDADLATAHGIQAPDELPDAVFVGGQSGGTLASVDVSSKTAPTVDTKKPANNIHDVIWHNYKIYYTRANDNTVGIVRGDSLGGISNFLGNVSDPTINDPRGIAVRNQIAVTADYSSSGISTIDVSDPTNPTLLDSYSEPDGRLSGCHDVHFLNEDYVIVLARLSDSNAILDISDPENISLVQLIQEDTELDWTHDGHIDGHRWFVQARAGDDSNNDGLAVVDFGRVYDTLRSDKYQ